jgi:uncharacterized membrane protein YeaQ/YmgE (transglycosylase-associated protein family)
VILGTLVLALALARKSNELAKLGFGFFALLAVTSVLVYLTGGSAEEAVERLPGFSETLVEQHEEAALVATIAIGSVGAFAAVLLFWFRRRPLPRWMTSVVFVATLGVAALMGYTANLGGQIRHTEIRSAGLPTGDAATGDISKNDDDDRR